jgi:hypothetical protein
VVGRPVRPRGNGRSYLMLWTILVIVVIVAVVLFILGQLRGRRGL